jgi:hypothetical protein
MTYKTLLAMLAIITPSIHCISVPPTSLISALTLLILEGTDNGKKIPHLKNLTERYTNVIEHAVKPAAATSLLLTMGGITAQISHLPIVSLIGNTCELAGSSVGALMVIGGTYYALKHPKTESILGSWTLNNYSRAAISGVAGVSAFALYYSLFGA